MHDMKLTSEAVRDMLTHCVFADDEPQDGAVVVQGIVTTFGFHPGRIARNADAIGALLADLPDEFQQSKGGGWTFLNACTTRDGEQWTDLHGQMEALFCLGIAAGRARWVMPRDMWDALPGGMPYVAVN
jgi:hypothetical protein